jgi:hypothetical protein
LSDFRAIEGVSRSIRTLLLDRMEMPDLQVTIAPPDVAVDGVIGGRLNLYLYQVNENAFLKNQDIPGLGSPGAYGRPPLSLNLHYLLTAHGRSETAVDADLEAQRILGDAMRVLHELPVVGEGLEITNPAAGTVGEPILNSALRGEFEQIKISLDPVTLEEFSKIWTALPQANFRRSVAYEVSVVQIESRSPRTAAPPVKERRVHLATLRRPEISNVYRTPVAPGERPGDIRAAVGQHLTIEGQNFVAPKTWVRLGKLGPIRVTPVGERIQIAVPDQEYPPDADHPLPRPIPTEERLQPGPQLVEVLAEREAEAVAGGLSTGTRMATQTALGSNQAVFVLVPEVSTLNPNTGPDGTVVRITGQRLFCDGLRTMVLIGDTTFTPLDPAAAESPPATVLTPTDISIRVTGLPPDIYPVRVRVNGADSMEDRSFEVT